MKKLAYILILWHASLINTFGQIPPGLECGTAPILNIWDLDNLQSSTFEFSNPSGANPLCPTGGAPHNTIWYAFNSLGGNYEIKIDYSNCTVNGTGLQAGIWGDCLFNESIDCDPSCTGPGYKFLKGNFDPSKIYYLFIDGCTGDDCDFLIQVSHHFPRLITNVFLDNNSNCILDQGEIFTKDFYVIDSFNGKSKELLSSKINILNNYEIGHHFFRLKNPLKYFENCSEYIEVDIDSTLDTLNLNFGLKPLFHCPLMNVELSINRLRFCNTATYKINYENLGTLVAENSYVQLEVPEELTYVSSSIPASAVNLPFITFNLGNVNPFQHGEFSVNFNTTCDPIKLGRTYCMEAHIYPDTVCMVDSLWSGGSLQLKAECKDNKVIFKAINVGKSDIIEALPYTIVEDEIMPLNVGQLVIPKGAEIKLEYPANGKTYRMIMDQVKHHPGFSKPTIAVEACGVNANGGISTGMVNQFVADEEDLFLAIECTELRGSYDPNDKQVVPTGFGLATHFIQNDTRLEYLINFQNLGNDSAERVRIIDHIDPSLDLKTFEIVGQSHPMYYVIQNGYVEFFFDQINLDYKSHNEPNSIGYVKYTIKPKVNLQKGTQINNDASIYFDYNPPIFTNNVQVVIFDNFVTKTYFSSMDNAVSVYPNPAVDDIQIDLINSALPIRLRISNLQGQTIFTKMLLEQKNRLDLNNFTVAEGIYMLQLENQKGQRQIIKLMISNK